MADYFSKKTFEYFKGASRNKNKLKWFEKNKDHFESYVFDPFSGLLECINESCGPRLPPISKKCLTKTLRAKATENSEFIRSTATAYISEKATSLFEWNPSVIISLGAKPENNFISAGLMMVSSRQMNLLRLKWQHSTAELDAILNQKKIKNQWGGLYGDKYKKFPKAYLNIPNVKYFWHKQFFLRKGLSKREIISRDFSSHCIAQIESALPFLNWLRACVGTYQPPEKQIKATPSPPENPISV